MSVRQGARDTGSVLWWTIVSIIVVAAIAVAMTFLWGNITPWKVSKQREINHNSQQFQDATVRQLRNTVLGINEAIDAGQKKVLTDQFCAVYNDLTDPPADLAAQYSTLC